MKALVIVNCLKDSEEYSEEIQHTLDLIKGWYHLVFTINNTMAEWSTIADRNKTILIDSSNYKKDLIEMLTDLEITDIDIVGNAMVLDIADLALAIRATPAKKETVNKVTIWLNLTTRIKEEALTQCYKKGIDIKMCYA